MPRNEVARQAAVDRSGVIARGPDGGLQTIVEEAVARFRVPIAAVTIIDRDRQWFAARHGIAGEETARSVSFCAHAILRPGEPMVVLDATYDRRFARHPMVIGEPNIRFYAGVPLVDRAGYPLGALCIVDTAPRGAAPDMVHLGMLARAVERRIGH